MPESVFLCACLGSVPGPVHLGTRPRACAPRFRAPGLCALVRVPGLCASGTRTRACAPLSLNSRKQRGSVSSQSKHSEMNNIRICAVFKAEQLKLKATPMTEADTDNETGLVHHNDTAGQARPGRNTPHSQTPAQ
ncbi:hypothetical protein chiPu_0027668 [Chiloscyllium punctatum]|uniref:Uncharacterized protein n=1 Tax=Chiloscyllium punctatum TaxID=137246 RepID=A0A401TM65_CHIPU|nr:hypothetical protein [Chiloscyllium punctatum]